MGSAFASSTRQFGGEGPVTGVVGWGFGPMEATSEWNRLCSGILSSIMVDSTGRVPRISQHTASYVVDR